MQPIVIFAAAKYKALDCMMFLNGLQPSRVNSGNNTFEIRTSLIGKGLTPLQYKSRTIVDEENVTDPRH